jgi:hypothetical protein
MSILENFFNQYFQYLLSISEIINLNFDQSEYFEIKNRLKMVTGFHKFHPVFLLFFQIHLQKLRF